MAYKLPEGENSLDNLASYDDIKVVRSLLKCYDDLRGLAKYGNTTAFSIYYDLKTALYHKSVTELQRKSVQLVLINKLTISNAGDILGKSMSTIAKAVDGGVTNIHKQLLGGIKPDETNTPRD